jgi:hypothetical protein
VLFDAEAIGTLELSRSESFRQDLRKTLGFGLVDTLLRDLDAVQSEEGDRIKLCARMTPRKFTTFAPKGSCMGSCFRAVAGNGREFDPRSTEFGRASFALSIEGE